MKSIRFLTKKESIIEDSNDGESYNSEDDDDFFSRANAGQKRKQMQS